MIKSPLYLSRSALRLLLLLSSALGFSVSSINGQGAVLSTVGGDNFHGECLNIENGVLLWRSAYKDTIHVPLNEVKEIDSGEYLWDLSFKDGQAMRASWSFVAGVLHVRSKLFGDLQCSVGELASAERAVSAKGLAEPPPPTASASDSTAAEPAAPATNVTPTSSLQTLLRQSSILLRPGQWSVSTGLSYTHSRVVYSQYDTRQVGFDGLIQHGITPRVEASLQWQSAFTRQTKYSSDPSALPGSSTGSDTLRAGNPEFSLATMLFGEGRIRPECLAVGGLTIPVNAPVNGGIFAERVGLEFLKTSDPGALFAGIGWSHEEGGWSRSPYQPLDHVLYHFGAAIGMNDELALGFQVQGEFRSELRDREHLFLAPSQEPVAGRFWANFRAARNCFIETSATLPMNDDNHTTTLSITYIQKY